jgi:ABC-type phosphate transport system auxiliary subunit
MVNIIQLEQELNDRRIPTVNIDQPVNAADQIGRITGEAISAAHEAAAIALAELGKELAERIRQIDALKMDADLALKDCLDVAQHYREAGQEASREIALTTKLTAEVRETCTAIRKKIEQRGHS